MKKITVACLLLFALLATTFASCSLNEPFPGDTSQESVDAVSSESPNISSAVVSDSTSTDSSDITSSSYAPESDFSSDISSEDVSSDTSDTHIHSFTETVILEPTCTENGKKEIACECGYSAQEEILATGHKEAWVVVKNATEVEDGLEKAVCEVCGADLGEERAIPTIPTTHTCTFVKGKTTAPTCTEKGYTVYTCSCGKSENRDYDKALGHLAGDWETVKEATTSSAGVKQIKCTRCGTVLEEETISKLPSEEDKYNVPATAENAHLVEERVLYCLNQYRIAEGTAEATFLWEGKTYKYAKARAEQLVANFDHDTEDIRSINNELKFGEYYPETSEWAIDPVTGEWYETGNMTEPYYAGGCSEAITKGYGQYDSIDDLAQAVATNIYASKTHWSYVGAETTQYITVGVYCFWNTWYICIATSSTDKYD